MKLPVIDFWAFYLNREDMGSSLSCQVVNFMTPFVFPETGHLGWGTRDKGSWAAIDHIGHRSHWVRPELLKPDEGQGLDGFASYFWPFTSFRTFKIWNLVKCFRSLVECSQRELWDTRHFIFSVLSRCPAICNGAGCSWTEPVNTMSHVFDLNKLICFRHFLYKPD